MASYLERAHTGWLGAREGHMVRFYEARNPDDPDGPGIIVADFTPKDYSEPTLLNLSMEREAVMELFPQRDRTTEAASPTSSWQPQITEMLDLMKDDQNLFAKAAARKVEPERVDALYRAFRTLHPGKVRSYYRD